jgi:type IX secretion system PorP/SprF family membrane protein
MLHFATGCTVMMDFMEKRSNMLRAAGRLRISYSGCPSAVFMLFYLLAAGVADCHAQSMATGTGYQMVLMNNPAYSGSSGAGSLRLSYLDYYPGNNYNFHTVYFSYDSYFKAVHGGAGFFLSDDYLGGIINDLRATFSYSYFLQAGDNLYFNAGLSASVLHRGYSFGRAVLPDQIDPLGGITQPSAETLASRGKTIPDVAAGFMFISGNYSGGISMAHLSEPSLSDVVPWEKLKRTVFFNLAGDFSPYGNRGTSISPQLFSEVTGGYWSASGGGDLELSSLGLNAFISTNSNKCVDFQAGFAIGTGNMRFYYNYVFNIVSGSSLLPFSLLHQAGLVFGLNSVEKRKGFKTINFPK